MRLNDPLVTEIDFQGLTYPLDLAFDNVLDVFDIINDQSLTPYEKLDSSLALLIGDNVFDKKQQADYHDLKFEEKLALYADILGNHIMIADEHFVELDVMGEAMPVTDEKLIDLELDASFIYASFFALGINLFQQQGQLSWMEFQALLEALPDDSIMAKIIQIRRWQPTAGDSPERVAEMERLQRKYALPGAKVGEADE